MSSSSQRRSDRVSLTLLIDISGSDSRGEPFNEPTRTLLINRHGGVIVCHSELVPGQQIRVQRRAPGESHREAQARIVNQFGRQQDEYLYGIEIVDKDTDLWGIEFPPVANCAEMVARMLLQCTYCHGREVVYLNEMELRGFEMNRGIARYCKSCGVPSIWTQAPHEREEKAASRAKRGSESEAAAPHGEEQRRQRTRMKTRLTACIRQAGADDELAVCDDISPTGMCFRSKRDYEAGALIEVAVPYSPDAANIFLAARVVHSEKAPKASYYRYGTEYRQSGSN